MSLPDTVNQIASRVIGLERNVKEIRDKIQRVPNTALHFGGGIVVTPASGVLTVNPRTYFRVNAETGTSDDVDTITATHKGHTIVLFPIPGHTITIKDNTGNIRLPNGDAVLDADYKSVMLLYSEVLGYWQEITRGATNAGAVDHGLLAGLTDVADHPGYVTLDGVRPLTGDWDIGDGRKLLLERIDARDADGIKIYDDAGNLILHLEDEAYVGIRRANPKTAYVMEGNTQYSVLIVERPDTPFGRGAVYISDTIGTPGRNAQNAFLRSVAGGAVASGVRIGQFDFAGHDGTDYNLSCQFYGIVDGAVSANTVPTRFVIATSPTNSAGLVERISVWSNGRVTIGDFSSSTPQGFLHMHDGTSGWLKHTVSIPDGTAVTVIPNGAKDIMQLVTGRAIIKPSTGSAVGVAVSVANGASQNIYSSGSDVVALAVAADGSMTLTRTGGVLTYTILLSLEWM